MNILGINGSHRPGKGTAALLQTALSAAESQGAQTELVELGQLDIKYCVGCNACMRKPACALHDDMDALMDKMRAADGIIVATPDYFSNVSARIKCFMDRTRCMHMAANALKGKVAGGIVTAGLDNCGAEGAMAALDTYFATMEMLVVHPRPQGPLMGSGAIATQLAGFDEARIPSWRNVQADPVGAAFARQLGIDMVELIARLS